MNLVKGFAGLPAAANFLAHRLAPDGQACSPKKQESQTRRSAPKKTAAESYPPSRNALPSFSSAVLWICDTRLSFTPSSLPIGFIVRSWS